jgi:Fe-S-cluster containining protein
MKLPTLPAIAAKPGHDPCLGHGCSACCHGIEMILTEADLERLQEAVQDPALADARDFWFRAEDGYLQLRTRDGPGAMEGATHPCIFLAENGRCRVHAVRPEGCRLYPAFWVEEARHAELDDVHCPHTAEFLLPQATSDAVRRLATRLQQEQQARAAQYGAP